MLRAPTMGDGEEAASVGLDHVPQRGGGDGGGGPGVVEALSDEDHKLVVLRLVPVGRVRERPRTQSQPTESEQIQ